METTATKERPILFSGAMVRAILEGRKTQTRRIVKPQPEVYTHRLGIESLRWRDKIDTPLTIARECLLDFCPYGQPGDRLWVRETWAYVEGEAPAQDEPPSIGAMYRATFNPTFECEPGVWKPSIHMPRWASRILLEVTDVRVERLLEMSAEDCMAEGPTCRNAPASTDSAIGWRLAFRDLWDSINGARPGCAWADDPWVWAVGFKVVTP